MGAGRNATNPIGVNPSAADLFFSYAFATTSSFSNFFSDEARQIHADLDYFLNHKGEYLRTGRPWTYTLCNSGPPGTGKTKYRQMMVPDVRPTRVRGALYC